MDSKKNIALGCMLAWLSTCDVFASAGVHPQVALSKTNIQLGEQTQVQITLQVPNPHRIRWPEPTDFPEKIEVVHQSSQAMEVSTQFTRWQYTYTLTGFDAGDYTIAGLPIVIQMGAQSDTLFTERVGLQITGVQSLSQPIYDINPILPIHYPWHRYSQVIILMLSVGVAVTLVFLWRAFFFKRSSINKMYDRTLKRLNTLEKQKVKHKGLLPETDFCQQLLHVLDIYFVETLGQSLFNVSKDEFAHVLKTKKADGELVKQLTALLREAERIRFEGPGVAVNNESLLANSRQIVSALHVCIKDK